MSHTYRNTATTFSDDHDHTDEGIEDNDFDNDDPGIDVDDYDDRDLEPIDEDMDMYPDIEEEKELDDFEPGFSEFHSPRNNW